MSFADLEARSIASVMARMANARGDFGSADFPVIFESGHVETTPGVSASAPLATVEDSNLVGCTPNVSQLRVTKNSVATTYIVRDVQPDSTGLSLLVLEKA